VMRKVDRHGPQPNQCCQQPEAQPLPLSANDNCSPDGVQHKEKYNDRKDGQEPDERLSRYRVDSRFPLLWYRPTAV
jgi:hypothetical protein